MERLFRFHFDGNLVEAELDEKTERDEIHNILSFAFGLGDTFFIIKSLKTNHYVALSAVPLMDVLDRNFEVCLTGASKKLVDGRDVLIPPPNYFVPAFESWREGDHFQGEKGEVVKIMQITELEFGKRICKLLYDKDYYYLQFDRRNEFVSECQSKKLVFKTIDNNTRTIKPGLTAIVDYYELMDERYFNRNRLYWYYKSTSTSSSETFKQ